MLFICVKILDLMLSTVTSIFDDTLNSTTIESTDLKPFNRALINDKYLDKLSTYIDNNDENISLCYSTTSLKQFFRTKHLHVAHPLRSSLWYNLLHRNKINQEYKFQRAIERYPEDIRYPMFYSC